MLSRRRFLAATGATLSVACSRRASSTPALRIAHITDVHVRPGNNSQDGLARCLQHIHALEPSPSLILNGGDCISDAWDASLADAKDQWDVWRKVFKQECGIQVAHCLGNHDKFKNGDQKLAMKRLGLSSPYYSFDHGPWHFVVLDSTFVTNETYIAKFDDRQFDWLAKDLADTGKPTLILSHIPILAVCPFFDGENEKSGHWTVPPAWMHVDARRLKDLFVKHPHVKLCLSGHIHLKDSVTYDGVIYVCDGAVSGKWWDGAYQETPPGYGLFDLRRDGTFAASYQTY